MHSKKPAMTVKRRRPRQRVSKRTPKARRASWGRSANPLLARRAYSSVRALICTEKVLLGPPRLPRRQTLTRRQFAGLNRLRRGGRCGRYIPKRRKSRLFSELSGVDDGPARCRVATIYATNASLLH